MSSAEKTDPKLWEEVKRFVPVAIWIVTSPESVTAEPLAVYGASSAPSEVTKSYASLPLESMCGIAISVWLSEIGSSSMTVMPELRPGSR